MWGIFGVVMLWTLVWKGLALWRAARCSQQAWFVILLLVNTLGILEILYLLFFRKRARRVPVEVVDVEPKVKKDAVTLKPRKSAGGVEKKAKPVTKKTSTKK